MAERDRPASGHHASLRKPLLLAFYIFLMYFALFRAPGSLTDFSEVRKIKEPNGNPLFRLLFSLLLAEGVGFFAVMSAGAASQPYPFCTSLFGVLGMALGFYGAGPYIALRNYAPNVSFDVVHNSSYLIQFMESRTAAVLVLLYSLRCYVQAFALQSNFRQSFTAFVQLTGKDRYAWASTLDILILTVVGYGLLTEDMRRRGWRFDHRHAFRSNVIAAAVLAIPGLGLGAYQLLRPRLPKRD